MKIWNYDGATGELVGTSEADPNPLTQGAWLIPARATAVDPGTPPSGHAAVFSGGSWSNVEDHRGTPVYDAQGNSSVIVELGPIPSGMSITQPPPLPPTVDELLEYSAGARYAKEVGGITLDGAPIATDRDSRGMITGAYNSAQRDSSWTTVWKATGGTFVTLTAAQVISMAIVVAGYVESCFAAEASTAAGIRADPPTITTKQQVDGAYAAVSSTLTTAG